MTRLGNRLSLRRRHAARDVLRHADRVRARRGRDRVHGHLHAGGVARYRDAERLRGDGLDHAAVDPAVHPQGRRDRQARAPARTSTRRCMPGCTAFPGGLGIANVFACALFAAMAGSSPATCSAIGSAGIPEMRKRGYSGGFAAGIIAAGGTLGILLPPSITMILYAVAAEQSLGPAVPRRHRAGPAAGDAVRRLCGVALSQGIRRRQRGSTADRRELGDPRRATTFTMAERFARCRACCRSCCC